MRPMASFPLRQLVGLVAIALAGACSRLDPGAVTGEVKMLVLAYDASSNGGEYKLVIGRVSTLHNLRTMEGDAAKILGGADIRVDFDELAREKPTTAEDLARITTKTAGKPVDFASFEVDGVIHPEDFHSLNIATIYYNFEKAHLFFADLNAALYGLPVQYFPSFAEGPANNLKTMTDNAFWDSTTRQFAILPFADIKELPLGMNVGVVAHEYTHAVYSNRFYHSEDGIPALQLKAWAEPQKFAAAMNLNRSFNEGLADYFGALVSGDPAFLRKSISQITVERRLDPPEPRCYTAELRKNLETLDNDRYDPYPVGSVLAAALWSASSGSGDRQKAFAQSVVDGMTEMGTRFAAKEDQITVADAVDALASTLIADLRPKACGVLLDHFKLVPTQVPSCGEVRPPERPCR
jgi:hypothetical protein